MTSAIELIKTLYSEGYFSNWKNLKEVSIELEAQGFNFSNQLVSLSLLQAVRKKILTRRKIANKWEYSQRQPPESNLGGGKVLELNKILSEITSKKLGDRFQQDIKELNVAFTYDCGNSAAFLLRKILEKAIFYVFSTNGKSSLLKTTSKTLGLEAMINLCSTEKINGVHILLPKTSKELLGLKFLGDSAAHDYLANIEVSDINHQISYWIMAIKQLLSNLK